MHTWQVVNITSRQCKVEPRQHLFVGNMLHSLQANSEHEQSVFFCDNDEEGKKMHLASCFLGGSELLPFADIAVYSSASIACKALRA